MLPQTYTIEARGGRLFIVERSPNYYEPVMDILWWPTGASAGRYEWHIGKQVYRDTAPGCFVDRAGCGARWQLLGGGGCVATYVEHEPIPRPKTRVDCEYRNGAWYKYLKGRGWVEV